MGDRDRGKKIEERPKREVDEGMPVSFPAPVSPLPPGTYLSPLSLRPFLSLISRLTPRSVSFDSLTPFKQKEYSEHIGSAKQEKTRISRLEKSIPLIAEGKGLNDKYR